VISDALQEPSHSGEGDSGFQPDLASLATLPEQIWGPDWGDSKSLDQHIPRLLRRLEQVAGAPPISTIRGVEYRLEP
jgi:DNA-binding response OmpR family regulator